MKYVKEEVKQNLLAERADIVDQSPIQFLIDNVANIFEVAAQYNDFNTYLHLAFQSVIRGNEREMNRLKEKFRTGSNQSSEMASKLIESFNNIKTLLSEHKESSSPASLVIKEHLGTVLKQLELEKDKELGQILRQKARQDMKAMKTGRRLNVEDWSSYQFLKKSK